MLPRSTEPEKTGERDGHLFDASESTGELTENGL
jgi:hypothetical protein